MSKNYTEVLIDGVVYTLGGAEEEEYLRRVAAYLNDKVISIRREDGFRKMNTDYQQLMIQLNIADDYFKQQERANALAQEKAELEKDTYSLKHELVTTQLRLESVQRELEFERKRAADLEKAAESVREGGGGGARPRRRPARKSGATQTPGAEKGSQAPGVEKIPPASGAEKGASVTGVEREQPTPHAEKEPSAPGTGLMPESKPQDGREAEGQI